MKILIGCEFSGIVRDAFTALGHDAISCDLIDSEKPGKHYKGNILDILYDGYDALIAFPPCTRRANSGIRWIINNPERLLQLRQDDAFFEELWKAPIPLICIENPIPHHYSTVPKYSQIIQPWQYGHGETKATCLWLKGFPKLTPTNIVPGRLHRIHEMPGNKSQAMNRSRSYPGIAAAMAQQWGGCV